MLKRVYVDNNASEARDFCAIERTYLSQLRLGLLLGLLSASLLLNARLPNPDESDRNRQQPPLYGFPLATLYFIASILGIVAGILNYERLWKGLKDGAAFVQANKVHTTIMSLIALLIISTIVTLLIRVP